jgi:hypothetical protein
VVPIEVAIENRNGKLSAESGRRGIARKAGFDLAGRRTAIAVLHVAVIALFVRHLDSVAADREAFVGLSRIVVGIAALGFVGTGGRASVERPKVAVVALLGAFLVSVAANGLVALC